MKNGCGQEFKMNPFVLLTMNVHFCWDHSKENVIVLIRLIMANILSFIETDNRYFNRCSCNYNLMYA